MKNIVLDSNVAIALVIELPYSLFARQKVKEWHTKDVTIFVPRLWQYEVVSVMQKIIKLGNMKREDAQQNLDLIFTFDVKYIALGENEHNRVLYWAEQLNQNQAYDASYLALAERLHAEFWTADKRLYNRCQQLKLDWIYLIS
ncbi:MAG: hypothetical protein B6242_07990 [Anaerolineaceae bacterium 4572_78]|nr:MAG: hypothetical protein B6242_07990 [Anaerolineaceae bacterium 4572_78]